MKKFTIENALRFGWMQTKQNWATVALMYIIAMAVSVVFSGLIAVTMRGGDAGTIVSGLIQLISYVVSFWISYNIYKMLLKLVDGKKVKVLDVFHFENETTRKVLNYFLANVAYGLVVLVGLVLLVVPGIYFAVKYLFVPYLVLDKEMSVSEAFKKSSDITMGQKWGLVLYSLASFAVIVLGLIALVVGVIPAAMVVTFGMLYIYRKLADGSVHGEKDVEMKEVKAA